MGKDSGKSGGNKGGNGKSFDDTNRGVLFPNDKDGNESRPDFTGHVFIDPTDFEADEKGLVKIRLAGWSKEGRSGDYLSLAASTPNAKS